MTVSQFDSTSRTFVPRAYSKFSLRTLLILVTIAAALCGWLVLPTARARQFVSAMKKGEFRRVESMFHEPDDGFPRPWVTDIQARLSEVTLYPLTLQDLWQGERHMHIYSPYDPDYELRSFDYQISIRVTRWNVATTFVIH